MSHVASTQCKQIVFDLNENEYLAGISVKKMPSHEKLFILSFVFVERPLTEAELNEQEKMKQEAAKNAS